MSYFCSHKRVLSHDIQFKLLGKQTNLKYSRKILTLSFIGAYSLLNLKVNSFVLFV